MYVQYSFPFESFSVVPHDDGELLLNFGSDWNFHFHSFNGGKHYHLIQQFNDQTEVLARYEYNDAHIPQRKLGVNLLNSNMVSNK